MVELDTIYNEDCLVGMEDIPDNSIDLVVTDPPYKITSRGNGGNSGGMFQKMEVNNGKVFKHNSINITDWIDHLFRVLKDSGHCYIMTNNKNISDYLAAVEKSEFHFIKNLIWVKNNKIMSQTYMSQFEYVIMLRKGRHKRINHCGTSDVLQFPNVKMKGDDGKVIHDTEKPVGLVSTLIENSSKEGDVVLDPFIGIGTTAIAAINTGRNYIGYELDTDYHRLAEERVANHVADTGEKETIKWSN